MNRRSFLRTMVGGLAAGAAVRTWPFRIYSFPIGIAEHTTGFYPALCPTALEPDLWAASLTPLDINSADFGILIESYVKESMFARALEIDRAVLHCIKYGEGIAVSSKPIRCPIQLT